MPPAPTSTAFPDFLVQHGFITQASYDKVKQIVGAPDEDSKSPEQNKKHTVEEVLLGEKLIDEEDLTKARAAFLNLPYIDLRQVTVTDQVLNLIPQESRAFYHLVPFELVGDTLRVAVTNPSNLQALEALEFLGQKQNFDIQVFLASAASMQSVAGGKRDIKNVVGEALKDIAEKQEDAHGPVDPATQSAAVLQDAPIIKIVDVILTNAIEAKASDIHIEPSETDVRVRYRIDGILHTSLRLPHNVLSAVVSRIKILSNLKIDETRLPQDGRFHVDVAGRSVDFRVSILPLIYGEKVVMRILDKTGSVPTLEQLGIRGRGLAWIQENIKKTHGIFLITGPTGSGKSTTLYSILSLLNTGSVNIITLEDPVEYFIPGVNQSQINPDIGLTFASGLRSILRQDPNVIMVGEIRDEETAELAVHAALTGHLVFSTLHTNNSVGAVPRLQNMGIEPFLLNASINLIMAQRLVRKICTKCKKEIPIPADLQKTFKQDLKGVPPEDLEGLDMDKLVMFHGEGCENCGHTGYKGRLGIYEVLPMLPEVQEMLARNAPAYEIYETTLKLGMISIRQDGILKVLHGDTSYEEVVRVTKE